MYLALKTVSKVVNEVTYSWDTFIRVLEQMVTKMVHKLKDNLTKQILEKRNSKIRVKGSQSSQISSSEDEEEDEIEIGERFFVNTMFPLMHQALMSNVKQESVPFYNLILSLNLALLYSSIN